jgi:hypothetical protein
MITATQQQISRAERAKPSLPCGSKTKLLFCNDARAPVLGIIRHPHPHGKSNPVRMNDVAQAGTLTGIAVMSSFQRGWCD